LESDKERERETARERERSTGRGYYPRPRPATRRTTINPVVKVLTSATFIRGVMGVLTKAMKK